MAPSSYRWYPYNSHCRGIPICHSIVVKIEKTYQSLGGSDVPNRKPQTLLLKVSASKFLRDSSVKIPVLLNQPLRRGTADASTKLDKIEKWEVRDPAFPLRFAMKKLCALD